MPGVRILSESGVLGKRTSREARKLKNSKLFKTVTKMGQISISVLCLLVF